MSRRHSFSPAVTGLGPAASSRVKLQAFSKKVTLAVQAPAGGPVHGIEAPGFLLDESAGAFVHASEAIEWEVRQALACALPRLALGDAGEICHADIADQAADYLLDLLHDEVSAALRGVGGGAEPGVVTSNLTVRRPALSEWKLRLPYFSSWGPVGLLSTLFAIGLSAHPASEAVQIPQAEAGFWTAVSWRACAVACRPLTQRCGRLRGKP